MFYKISIYLCYYILATYIAHLNAAAAAAVDADAAIKISASVMAS